MRHPAGHETPMPAYARTGPQARAAGTASGFGRREFLTMATAGTAAAAISVTIAALDPAVALGAPASRCPSWPAPSSAPARKQALRALWIASVPNTDWPSAGGAPSATQQA